MPDSNIQQVRTGLKNWLSSKVRIDQWDLDKPADVHTLTPNTAIAYPVEDLQYFREGLNSIKGRGKFPYQIVFRYSGILPYHELPLSKLEGLIQYIQGQALINPPCANSSIVSLEVDDVGTPVNVMREGNDQSDWLIYCNFAFQIVFKLNAFDIDDEFKPNPDTPINPDFNLELNIYRAKVNFDSSNPDDSTLDSSLTISKT